MERELTQIGMGRFPERSFLLPLLLLVTVIGLPAFAADLPAQGDEDFGVYEVRDDTGWGIPVSGRLSFETARQVGGTDRWIRLGTSLDLIVDAGTDLGRFYFEGTGRFNLAFRVEGDDDPSDEETETILRELYWQRSAGRFTLSAGKIIDDRTVMDLLQVTDRVSVINRADYFFAEPEAVKLGQYMMRLAWFGLDGPDGLEAGALFSPYPAFDRVAEGDHPYALVPGQDLHKRSDNREDRRDMEGSVFISREYSMGGISAYAGRFNNRFPILAAAVSGDSILFYDIHEPYWSAGTALTLAVEPFLLKAELAWHWDKPLQASASGLPAGYIREDQAELALGTDINLGSAGMLTLEYLAAIPVEKNDALAVNRTTHTAGILWSDRYLSDKLSLEVVSLFPESLKNMINRFRAEYFLTDTVSVSAQYTRFDIREKLRDYGFMDAYDRIDFCLNFDFNLE